MKIPLSVRSKYDEINGTYRKLKGLVDAKIRGVKSDRWHYESRVKELESYALKLETGREPHPSRPEDMFGCTIVVENHSKVSEATALILNTFKEEYRRPHNHQMTSLMSHSFAFEDLRLYVSWIDNNALPPTGVKGVLFEIQIKTFLQHAWGIATHDLIYKSDEVNWGASRVAFQVKAMLENAELSISEAKKLTGSVILNRTDRQTQSIREVIDGVRLRWANPDLLPKNVLGLAKSILDLAVTLRLEVADVWHALDKATATGRGAQLLNLSPHSAIVEALVAEYGGQLFKPLMHPKNSKFVFAPSEVELPPLTEEVKKWIVTPMVL